MSLPLPLLSKSKQAFQVVHQSPLPTASSATFSTPSQHYVKFRTRTVQALAEIPLKCRDHPLIQALEVSSGLKLQRGICFIGRSFNLARWNGP